MPNHDQIAQRWAERATGQSDKPAYSGRSSNVFERDGKVYSYGTHFEMGRLVTPKRGAPFFLLNGDTYSNTTTRHQSAIRSAVAKTGVASVIIPHTALTSAGINLDTITPVDVLPEVSETIPHTVTVPGLVELGERAASGAFGWDDSNATDYRGILTGGSGGALSITRELPLSSGPDGARYSVRACKRRMDYARGGYVDIDTPEVSYYRNGGGLAHVEGDKFTYDTYRHWLGGVVFSADVKADVYRTCDKHERGVEPFGTGTRAWCDTCDGYVSETHKSGAPHRYRETVKRRAWFVSGWDENEPSPLYFLAELPKGAKPATYAEALDALAPAEVHAAIAAGLDVIRQGDIFAVPCDETTAPPRIAAKYAERGQPVPLDGTSRHIVSELVICADGGHERVYARGTMRHEGGDHRRVKLTGWHRLYRNLVPMVPVPETSYATQRTTLRAWTIAGRVD